MLIKEAEDFGAGPVHSHGSLHWSEAIWGLGLSNVKTWSNKMFQMTLLQSQTLWQHRHINCAE